MEGIALIGLRRNNKGLRNLFHSDVACAPMDNIDKAVPEVPRVYADFNNADRLGRVRLNTAGAQQDLAQGQIALKDGLDVELYDDEIVAMGVVRFDTTEGWVAEIDWSKI